MRRLAFGIATFVALFWPLAPTRADPPAGGGGGIAQRFRELDRDGDGKVTREEAQGLRTFDTADADGDGVLTLEEALAFYAGPRPRPQDPPAPPEMRPESGAGAPAGATADGFVPEAPFVGEVNGSYGDPEFSEAAGQVVFQDAQNRVWIGDLDPETGLLRTATGRDHLVDEDITIIFDRPPQGRKFSTNGPEWTSDERGHAVVYTKQDEAGVLQQWLARLVDGKAEVTQLTRGATDCYGNMPSRFQDGKPPRIAYTYDWPIWRAKAAWVFADRPGEPHLLEGFDYRQMSMWSAVSPEFLFIRRPEGAAYGQVARANTDTGEVTVLTDDEGAKDDPGLFRAPEFGGEVLLVCNVDNRALAVYRAQRGDGTSPWSRIATLTLPADAPYRFVSSPEPIAPATGVGGVSYFALLAREGKDRTTAGSVWVLGLGTDPEHRFARRVDDGALAGERAALLEPEPFVGSREVFVYYNYYAPDGARRGLRRAATGVRIEGGPPPEARDFAVDDVPLAPPGMAMSDPEFNDQQHRAAWWDYSDPDNVRVCVGSLDPGTGLFTRTPGPDTVVADHVSPFLRDGRWWAHNGPEWGRDRYGWSVYFTKEDGSGTRQLWRAAEAGARYDTRPVTSLAGGACGGLFTQDGAAADTWLMFYVPDRDTVVWATAASPNETRELPGFRDHKSIAHWAPGARWITYAKSVGSPPSPQLVYLDTDTGTVHQVSDEPGDKFDAWGLRAPEYGGEMLMMCVVDRREIAIYRDLAKDGRPWTRIATLGLPPDAPHTHLYSVEPIAPATGVGGTSWFTLNAMAGSMGRALGATGRSAAEGSIWVLSLGRDAAHRIVRRVDEGALSGTKTARYEAEAMPGRDEVFVYYERRSPQTERFEVRRCRTGIASTARPAPEAPPAPAPAPEEAGPLFRRVEVPGLTDIEEGTNGIAVADLDHDGLLDVVGSYSEPNSWRRPDGHRLRVFRNRGDFRFERHPITIRGSDLTEERFGLLNEIPNLVDFDGDGFLDLFVSRTSAVLEGEPVPAAEALGNTLLLSDGAWDRFRDVSARLGATNETGYNRQCSIADVDRDGWLDVAVGCDNIGNAMGGLPWSRLYLYRPKGERFEEGRFEDIGGTDLVPDFGGFHHDSAKDKAGPMVNLRDLDGDGDLDLLQSFHVDVRQPLLPYSPGEYRQGVFCWKSLLAETGEMRFEKVTGNGLACEARLRYDRERELYVPDGKAPGLPYVFVADVDNDARPDVLAIGPSDLGWAPRAEEVGGRFWRNAGGFRFEQATAAAGLDALNWTYREWYRFFGVKIAPAYEAWKPRQPNYFYSQPGLPQRHPLDDRFYFADAVLGDFDNDGWIDFVALDRHELPTRPDHRAVLFLNRGDGTFEPKLTTWSGIDGTGITGEAADLDGDGLLDLVIARDPDNSGGGLAKLGPERYRDLVYANTGAGGARENHWLRLRLSGIRHAALIGARVETREPGTGKILGVRWVFANLGYKSGCALEAHFGLGKREVVDLVVALPGGRQVRFDAVRGDRFLDLDLVEGKALDVKAGG